ncbi:MAG: hypothetical protein GX777_03020 [Fastidiosipila sp.]|nr:hypothetical protein [Fastidiosipila sp.]
MVDTEKLRNKVVSSGLKYKFLAEELGLSRYGLQLKIDGKNDFMTSEVAELCKLLNISTLTEKEAIFFSKKVD